MATLHLVASEGGDTPYAHATITCRTRHWPDRSGTLPDHDHETRVSVTCGVTQRRARAAEALPRLTEPANSLRDYPVSKVGQRVRVLTSSRCRSRDGADCLGAERAKSRDVDKWP